ncbi:hypothetical protein SM124_17195 [Bacillus sp. 31A1R]|uniref:Uncharacterized protein n=1 Tax=Robertmurraya mangrovi TaxID=3098077 RepID=A0ABU5J277_9BACI|nr:hypothetical protein [Bacillus sp. 31A1R]
MIVYVTYAILTLGVNTHADGFNQMVLLKQFLVKDEMSGGNQNH